MKLAIKMLLSGLAMSMAIAAAWAQTTVIKFSHVAASDSPKGRAALRFKELVEQASRYRVRVDVYPNGQLYKEADELEALQLGAVQMAVPSLAKLAQFGMPDFEVFDLPYVLTDKAAVARVTEGPLGKHLLKKLEARGMLGLAYWDNGFKFMLSNKVLRMPVDFSGQKMGIHSSRVLHAQMEALGATPRVLDANDAFAVLQSGVVDGMEATAADFYGRRLYEVQCCVTPSRHGYSGSAVVVNQKFWNNLPSDLRNIVDTAMQEASAYGNALTEQENGAALEWLKNSGRMIVYALSDRENAAWRQALASVHKELESRIGKAIVLAFMQEAAARRVSGR